MKQIDWRAWLNKNKFVLIVLIVGVILLLLPTGTQKSSTEQVEQQEQVSFDLEAFEEKLAAVLSQINGAGDVQVVLTVKGSTRQVFAQDNKQTTRENSNETTESTVVISRGSGNQDALLLEEVYPEFQGAVVVCSGADDMTVKLKIVEAVSALTGLGTDKISVCKSS